MIPALNPSLLGVEFGPQRALRKGALRSLRPPPRLRLSEWLETELRLPEGTSALPGPLRLWAYQVGIADAIGDPFIERVTVVKPVRVGFSLLLTGALASYVHNDPCPVLCLLPTEADCRDVVVSEIEPIFSATPVVAGALSEDVDDSMARNTLMHRRFPGGSLKVVAAKAPRNLRRHTVRVLLIDESDAMEVGAEGSPILLAERRTLSYPDRKIVLGSTPLHEETSHVLRAYGQSDQRIYEVPCPRCGEFAEILWSMIEWDPGQPDTAKFRCPKCQALVPEQEKPAMVAAGRWRATAPEVKSHAGFRLNALVSGLVNASWGKLAAEFLRVKDDSDELQTFVNTILGQGWREAGSEIDEADLAGRAEEFSLEKIPPEVLVVTAGVDVQDDRLETSFVGWSRTEAFILGHVIIWGSPDEDETWTEQDDLLKTKWKHPAGGRLGVDCCMVDSGDRTDKVYAYCFPRLGKKIMAVKGVSGSHPVCEPSKSKVRGGRLFLAGIDTIRSTIYDRLARGRLLRFSNTLEPSYYEQLTSHRKVIRYRRGQAERRYEQKVGVRDEALDCVTYAWAARQMAAVNLDNRELALQQEIQDIPATRRRVIPNADPRLRGNR